MDYSKYKINKQELLEKFKNKETFKLLAGATWCPDCNLLKYGTEEISDGTGMLANHIDDSYVMFEEVCELEKRNIELIPLMVHIEDITGVCYRDITFGFDEEENKTINQPNIGSYRPGIPFVMSVKDGVPTYIQSSFENEDVFKVINKN